MSGTLHKANHCLSGRVERRCLMARSANPDQDFSAGYRNAPDLENWQDKPTGIVRRSFQERSHTRADRAIDRYRNGPRRRTRRPLTWRKGHDTQVAPSLCPLKATALTCTGSGPSRWHSGPFVHKRCKRCFDLAAGASFENPSLQSHGASSRFHVSQRGLCIRRVVWIHEHSRASGAGDTARA